MTEHEVQKALDSGLRLGVVKPTGSDDYLGWILVTKHPASLRLNEILDKEEHPQLVQEQAAREKAPYLVQEIELRREVHNSGDYETNEDYRLHEKTWCKDLRHVSLVLKQKGVELHSLVPSREIDAP